MRGVVSMGYEESLQKIATFLDQAPDEPVLSTGTAFASPMLTGSFMGRSVSVHYGPYRWLSGDESLDSNPTLADMVINPRYRFLDIVVSRIVECFFPAHQLAIHVDCHSPMTVILGQGGEPWTFGNSARQHFISNNPNLCKQWFSQPEVDRAIAMLCNDLRAKVIFFPIGGTGLELRLRTDT